MRTSYFTPYGQFVIVNVLLGGGIILLLLGFRKSLKSWGELRFALRILAVAVVVIIVQYPALRAVDGWLVRTLLFYASMVVFLFLSGLVLSKLDLEISGSWATKRTPYRIRNQPRPQLLPEKTRPPYNFEEVCNAETASQPAAGLRRPERR